MRHIPSGVLPWESEPKELAIDAFHHAVHPVATGAAFAALEAELLVSAATTTVHKGKQQWHC